MLRDTKDIVINYSLIGMVIGVFTMIVRPFISFKQTVRDTIIVFVFTILSGLLLENWHDFFNESVRMGMAGVLGFYAVRIYEVSIAIFSELKNHPEIITHRIGEKDD